MPVETRTFRLFVSSTFDDLKDERDALQREVFPRIRELCHQHGARFQAIDLRWGVRDEAALDQKTLEICLHEIQRCKDTGVYPNFIVLLGNRYGWRPLPVRIEAAEFDAVRARIADAAEMKLVNVWYARDDNAEPAEYVLKPRTGDWVDAKRWGELEERMHTILQAAAQAAGLKQGVLVKYWASATHQEILKGLGTTEADRRHVFAFCRRGQPAESEVTNLRNLLPDVTYYTPGALKKLCARVYAKLERVILSEIARFANRSPLAVEIETHDRFGLERARHFVGRVSALRAIEEYIHSGERRVFILSGPSGAGKSAVMAHASSVHADAIRRFVGASPESSNAVALLTGLCRQMGMPDTGVSLPELASSFQECLSKGRPERPVIVFIDGLDQLDDTTWLPSVVPPHCRLVVSMEKPLERGRSFELPAMPVDEAAELLNDWLTAAGRKLNDNQRQRVLRAYSESGLPLYLKLAFEEARRWGSSDPPILGEGIDGILDVMTARLSDHANHGPVLTDHSLGYLTAARDGVTEDEIVGMLSDDDQVWTDFIIRTRHAPPSRRLPAIVWLRLLIDLEPYVVEIATAGGAVVTWHHRWFRKWFAAKYNCEAKGFLPHRVLADQFGKEPLWLGDAWRGRRVPNYRKLRELPYQQTMARMEDELSATLGDVAFLEAKFLAEMEYDILTDCERATAIIPATDILKASVSRAIPALRARPDYALQTLCNSLAWVAGEFSALSRSLKQARETLDRRGPWLELESKPAHEPSTGSVSYRMPFGSAVQTAVPEADLLAFVDYKGKISAHRMSTGQQLFTRSLPVDDVAGISAAGRSVAFIERNGRISVEQCSLTFAGRRRENKLFYDGRWIFAAREDDALAAWRIEDGNCLVLEAPMPNPLVVLKSSASGTALCVAGVREQRVGIIRIEADHCSYEPVPYHGAQILDAELDPGGERILTACADHRVRIISTDTGSEICALAYERLGTPTLTGRVEHCCFGRGEMTGRAIFSTADAQIAGWDWETGNVELIVSDVPEGGVQAYYMLRGLDSGRILASRLEDVALLAPSTPLRHDGVHRREVTSVGILDTGQIVSFSAGDRSIIWHSADRGAPNSRHDVLNATAMIVLPGTNDVVVADSRGAVWKERPGGSQPEGSFLTESITGMCDAGSGFVAIGAASGSILCLDPEAKISRPVRSAIWGMRQIGLIPAGRCGLCWAREVVTKTGGNKLVLALVSNFGWEKCRLYLEAHAVATGEHGSTLCYADASGVYVRRRHVFWFFPAYAKQVKASQVAVLEPSGLLAVTRADDNWLEIWRLAAGLPLVAAAELPGIATCINSRKGQIAVGFSSGEVLWFRLRKGMDKT